MLKQKTRFLCEKAKNAALPVVTVMTTSAIFLTQQVVNADATELMTTVIKILAKLIIALAVILAVFGLTHYAAANSEGDGPAKHKAMMQVASAVMLVILSVILTTAAPTLAGMLETSI